MFDNYISSFKSSIFYTMSRKDSYSPGLSVIMADRQIKRALDEGKVTLEEIGNAKAFIEEKHTGKWFMIWGGWGNDQIPTAMLGAICGDVAGSIYEWNNIKHIPDTEKLIAPQCRVTDDSIMTCAVATGIVTGLKKLPDDWMHTDNYEDVICDAIRENLRIFGRKYPNAGYGGSFRRWLTLNTPDAYGSYGNGSAMRVSFAGWASKSLEEAEKLGELSAKVTHNHPEGVKGAKVVAGCIYLLRTGKSKADVAEYVSSFYNMDFTLDMIRPSYRFDVTCQGSVPQAIQAFLEGENFVEVIGKAISIGGDSDTIAAIAGSIAEVIYPIPQGVRGRVIDRMDEFLLTSIHDAVDYIWC